MVYLNYIEKTNCKEVLDIMGGKVVECELDRIMQCAVDLGIELDMKQDIEQWIQQIKRRSYEIGIEEGIKQGIEEGIKQGRAQIIENMLKNKKTPAEIAEFCSIEIQEIENVQKRMIVNI